MKKAVFTFMLAALLAMTACVAGNETATEAPPSTIGSISVEETTAPATGEKGGVVLPEGSFDRQFSGFWNENGGWFVGCEDIEGTLYSNHYMYQTNDGGKTWTETYRNDSYGTWPVTCAFFANEDVGFLGLHYDFEFTGSVLYTEDGCKTWTVIDMPNLSVAESSYWQREPREIHEVNGNIEITYFVSTSGYGETGLLYTTVSDDMGRTWGEFIRSGEVQGAVPSGSFDRQFSSFWTPNNGWFVGCENNIDGNFTNNRHYIYLTSDGGVTWAETGNLNDYWTTPVTCSLFINDSVGLLGFHYDLEFTGPVYRTEDGGKTWTELNIPTFKEVISRYWQREPIEIREFDGCIDITYFVSTSYYGDAGLLYTASSTDMGKTWGPFAQTGEIAGTIPTGSFDSHLMYYSNFNTGWFFGSKALDDASKYQHYLYRTDDKGNTWMEVSNLLDYSTEPLTFVFFQNDSLGYVGFRYTADEPGKVFRTDDGGMTWVEEDISALYAVPGYNHRANPYEVRNWGDTLGLEYFVFTSKTGDIGQMYLSFSWDWVSWGAFELKPE